MKIDKYNLYEQANYATPFQLSYSAERKIAELKCDIDHSSAKNLNWDDDHCGLSYYYCPKCKNMYTFW